MREWGEREKERENEKRKKERESQYIIGGPQYFTIWQEFWNRQKARTHHTWLDLSFWVWEKDKIFNKFS